MLHIGGPVEEQSGWCLARARDADALEGFVPVLGDLGLVDLELDPDHVGDGVLRGAPLRRATPAGGRASSSTSWPRTRGSSPTPSPTIPFLPDGPGLWRRILARQGGPLARLALFPADPSLN